MTCKCGMPLREDKVILGSGVTVELSCSYCGREYTGYAHENSFVEVPKPPYKACCPKCGDDITGAVSHRCYANGQSYTTFRRMK